MNDMTLSQRATAWHRSRWPDANEEHVGMKLASEAGEVLDAQLAILDLSFADPETVLEELADVQICIYAIAGRWYSQADLERKVATKIEKLETPGAHKSSLQKI